MSELPKDEVNAATERAPGPEGETVDGFADMLLRAGREEQAPKKHVLLLRGEEVDHFKVIKLLGRGGMGEVYSARDTKLGRKVALKIVQRSALGDSADAVERFLFEARMTAKFSHPHIVQVYAVGEYEGMPYLALEYLQGQTLRKRFEEERFAAREAARAGLAIAEALAEAHAHHVFHRDLKPENVLVPPDGRLRVVDFGLASRDEDAPPMSAQTFNDVEFDSFEDEGAGITGTPRYMAPEQWVGGKLDGTVDVWALGLILYEMVDGRHPFDGLRTHQITEMVGAVEPLPAMQSREALPILLVELIESCVAKESEERPSASQVVERLRGFLNLSTGRLEAGESPFRGLLPFTEQHAGLFYGREAEVEQFVEQLRHQALLMVVGPSGAGKSSFVRAGVIPRLRDTERWLVVRFRPGSRPFETLARQLLRLSQGRSQQESGEVISNETTMARDEVSSFADALASEPGLLALELRAQAELREVNVLLVVDQLEELVTLVEDEEQRDLFMVSLCKAADEPVDPVRVVLTVRDDFVGRLATSAEVRDAASGMVFLQRPGVEALEETLRKPLEVTGFTYDDPQLPTEMVAAVSSESACLPLLQFAARQLWDARDRDGQVLMKSAYEAMGGVEGALAKHADGVLQELSVLDAPIARQLLLRLVTSERTRRVVTRADLLDGLRPEASEVLERLTGARLLTVRKQRGVEVSRSTVELTHESLISRWATLCSWLDEGREEHVLLAEATQAAELWAKRGERADELWRGDALIEARRVLAMSTQAVPDRVRRFIELAQSRELRRLRFKRLVVAMGFIALSIVAGVLLVQNLRVDQQRDLAERNEAEALVEGARGASERENPLEARAMLRVAFQSVDSASARALWWQLRDEPLVWKKDLSTVVYSVEVHPNGQVVAAACGDQSVYLFDLATRAVRVLRGHQQRVASVAYSPDGTQLASSDFGGSVRVWSVKTGEVVRELIGHDTVVRTVSFSADGSLLATGSDDRKILVWNLRTGAIERTLTGHEEAVWIVRFSPVGLRLASGSLDETIRTWDVLSGKTERVLLGHTSAIYGLNFNPAGDLLASGSQDNTIRLWDVKTGRLRRTLSGHESDVRAVNFSSGGDLLASGGQDKTVRVWNVKTGEMRRVLKGHQSAVYGVSFGPNGNTVVSGGRDKSVRLWDVRRAGSGLNESGHTDGVYGATFNFNQEILATGSRDKTVRLWDVRSGREIRSLTGHTATVMGMSFRPGSNLLASGSWDKTVRLWDALTGRVERVLIGHEAGVMAVGFSPSGDRLASGGWDKVLRLWEPGKGKLLATLKGHDSGISGVGFSPDGQRVATASWDKSVRLWNVKAGVLEHTLLGHREVVLGVSFGSQGQQVASGSADRTVRLWDARTGKLSKQIEQPSRAHWIDVHPDGKLLGVPSSDGVARLWDLEQQRVVRELRGHRGEVNGLRFSVDGGLIATTSEDNTVRLWRTDTGKPVWRAPLLLRSPARLWTHLGWVFLDGTAKGATKPGDAKPLLDKKWHEAVDKRARHAEVDASGKQMCLQAFDGKLEFWSLEKDELLREETMTEMTDVRVVAGGCLVLMQSSQGGSALFVSGQEEPKALAPKAEVTAIGNSEDQMFVASGKYVVVFDAKGAELGRHLVGTGVSAVTRIDAHRLGVGFADGNLALVDTRLTSVDARARDAISFDQTPSSVVTRLLPGPMDTLVAGFASGVVGMWSLNDGKRLAEDRRHGAIEHLMLADRKLYAATGLGQHLVWDLSTFYAEWCALLEEVWHRVPVVWKSGRAVAAPPPESHICHRSGTN